MSIKELKNVEYLQTKVTTDIATMSLKAVPPRDRDTFEKQTNLSENGI